MDAAPTLVTHPVTLPRAAGDPASGDPVRLRVASINVFYANGDTRASADFIRRERPDAVALLEMDAQWRRALARAGKGLSAPLPDDGQRRPRHHASVAPADERRERAAHRRACRSRRFRPPCSRRGGTCGYSPCTRPGRWHPNSAARRNLQLMRLAEQARAATLPLVVVGDMNIHPVLAALPAAAGRRAPAARPRKASAGRPPGPPFCRWPASRSTMRS